MYVISNLFPHQWIQIKVGSIVLGRTQVTLNWTLIIKEENYQEVDITYK